MRTCEVRGKRVVRIALAACLLLGAGLGSAASAGTTYRLVPPSFLDVGNQWVYQAHRTLDDNVPVDSYDTVTWGIMGSQTVAGYPTRVQEESWALDGEWDWGYMDLTDDYLRAFRDEDDDDIEEVTGNDPTELLPVWCSDTYNQLHFGRGHYAGWEIANPTNTWTGIEDVRITFLARENVTVGAGTFLCTKVLLRLDWGIS